MPKMVNKLKIILDEKRIWLIYGILLSVGIFLLSDNQFFNFELNIRNFDLTYLTIVFSFWAIYITLISITTNISQEFPYSVGVKYLIFSKYNYFLTSFVFSNMAIYFIVRGFYEFLDLYFFISIFILFSIIVFYSILHFKGMKIKSLTKYFFKDLMGKMPANNNVEISKYKRTYKDNFFEFNSKDYVVTKIPGKMEK